jgi:putative transposase
MPSLRHCLRQGRQEVLMARKGSTSRSPGRDASESHPPGRAGCKLTDAARFSLVPWSQLFNWRAALMIVKPETLIGWHRKRFKLFWRWRSRLGRPRTPENLRQLIVRIVQENPTWGEERIAAELSVKLGILVSPRTVRAYWPQDSDPRGCRRISNHRN